MLDAMRGRPVGMTTEARFDAWRVLSADDTIQEEMSGLGIGLETLLELDGSVLEQEGGFWIKIEARQIRVSVHAPHGIRYSLTLHDRYGTRVLGYDNAHAVRPPKKFMFAGQRLPYDHWHRTSRDQGVPYAFESAQRLLEDFFTEVDRVIKEAQQ